MSNNRWGPFQKPEAPNVPLYKRGSRNNQTRDAASRQLPSSQLHPSQLPPQIQGQQQHPTLPYHQNYGPPVDALNNPTQMPYNQHYGLQNASHDGPSIAPISRPQPAMNSTGFGRRLNPDATPFHPGVRVSSPNALAVLFQYVPQSQSQPPVNNFSPYASYMNEPSSGSTFRPQEYRPPPQQHQRAVYDVYQQQPPNYGMVGNRQMQPNYNQPIGSGVPTHNLYGYHGQMAVLGQQQQQQQQQYATPNNPGMDTPLGAVPNNYYPLPVIAQPTIIQNQEVHSTVHLSPELMEKIVNCSNKKAIIEIQIGMEQLAKTPGDYDVWCSAISSRLSVHMAKSDVEIVAWLLVEMAYLCPNTQYNFSRLCKFIDSFITGFTTQSVVPRITTLMTDSLRTLTVEQQGYLALFLAELYDKSEVNGVRMARLGLYLLDLLRNILNSDPLNDQQIRSVVQVLKLTGRYIEDDQDPTYLNELFEKLNTIRQGSRSISESAKHSIKQLNDLRGKQWGIRNDADLNGTAGGDQTHGDITMYGPDGSVMTEEETRFMEDNCYKFMDSSGSGHYDDDDVDYERYLNIQPPADVAETERALGKMNIGKRAPRSNGFPR